MKIAILTLTPSHNYGGVLQAVALYSYLEGLGHNVVMVNKKLYQPLWKIVATKLLEQVPFQNLKNKRAIAKKTARLKIFIDKYLPNKSKKIVSKEDLCHLIETEKFDAIVVGSDQVWRYQYINDGHHNVYFLDVELSYPIKKIAYAASFGKDQWEAPHCVVEISQLLGRFDVISTREKSGVLLCKNIFGVSDAQNTLDPTMLVGAGFYNRFLVGYCGKQVKKTIVTYILDESESKRNIISNITTRLEGDKGVLQQISLADQERNNFYSVEEWLWHMKNADFVITDSFHGMVFSILFEKQFVVIGNEERGLSRFTDLLDALDLEERLLFSGKNNYECLKTKINYSKIAEKLKVLQEFSEAFLKESLPK